jgi:hypothetical protein
MRDSWLRLIDGVLRPARPRLEGCLRERERHLETRRSFEEARARAIAQCEARIEAARAQVLAANDGVVTSRMTELEREWRRLSRPDPDAGLMDLWARVAPPAWIDRKRWRDAAAASRLERDVHEAARTRFAHRPVLARAIAHAAYVDFVWRAASLRDRPDPVGPLRDLWKTGYVLAAAGASGVTLEIPPLADASSHDRLV